MTTYNLEKGVYINCRQQFLLKYFYQLIVKSQQFFFNFHLKILISVLQAKKLTELIHFFFGSFLCETV